MALRNIHPNRNKMIKSIQQVVFQIPASAASCDLTETINAVDLSKSEIRMQNHQNTGAGHATLSFYFDNATTVRCKGEGFNATLNIKDVAVSVVEHY